MPAAISSSPPTRGQVPGAVRNSACGAVGAVHAVASVAPQSVAYSDGTVVSDVRAGVPAGIARNSAPFVRAAASAAQAPATSRW